MGEQDGGDQAVTEIGEDDGGGVVGGAADAIGQGFFGFGIERGGAALVDLEDFGGVGEVAAFDRQFLA